MAIEPSASQVQPAAASGASGRVGGTGGRVSAADSIEGSSGSTFVNLADQWRTGNDPGLQMGMSTTSQQQQTANQWLRGGGTPILFTPLVQLAAAAYPAGATFQEENSFQSALSPSDLQRGVGTYEYYMRVTSGSTSDQGKVLNHFS